MRDFTSYLKALADYSAETLYGTISMLSGILDDQVVLTAQSLQDG